MILSPLETFLQQPHKNPKNMQKNLPFSFPDCVAFRLESTGNVPNPDNPKEYIERPMFFYIPIYEVKDKKDKRLEPLKKRLLTVFKEEEVRIIHAKEETEDKVFFTYEYDFYGLPIVIEYAKPVNLPIAKEAA
jgi:hypothetical protein